MTPEAWRQIEDLYYAALERGPGALADTDPSLKHEVEVLLALDKHAGGILDEGAADLFNHLSGAGLLVGTMLGPYRIDALAGTGGMGEVYRAYDTRLQRVVAIKVLPVHLSSSSAGHKWLEEEAKSLSKLQHPNICVVFDIGSQEGMDFMVMEFLPGQILRALIPQSGMPIEIAVKYALQIAEALSCAHTSGVVHLDLKPGNIMVDDSGFVKVLDFGIAKLAAPTLTLNCGSAKTLALTKSGAGMGTLPYMSPEQALGKPIDASSDVFSFGSTFYEMLTGQQAFQRDSNAAVLLAVAREDALPIREQRRDIPNEVVRIIDRCLKKEPEARYRSGLELAEDLKKCRDLLFPEDNKRLSVAYIGRIARRPPVLAAMVLVLLILAGGSIWAVGRHRQTRWARDVAVPEVARLIDEGKIAKAYLLAVQAEKSIPDDRTLGKLWPVLSYPLFIQSTPPGAQVYRRDYADQAGPWQFVGTTPIRNLRQPRGMYVWKFEKPSFATVIRLSGVPHYSMPRGDPAGEVLLDEPGRVPPRMVRVSPTHYSSELAIPGYDEKPGLTLADYWIDKYEVTNREYKRFVDQGGYRKRTYWKVAISENEQHLSWDQAMARFRDKSGEAGPAGWIQRDYQPGQADFPVTGISWYEAAAYAEFAGKSLPTLYHWNRAAGIFSAAYLVPASNVGGAGILPVGAKQGFGPWGTLDMAGNVKEWVWNEGERGTRYVLGGAWNEPDYMFTDPDARLPMLRASNIGFRCVKYITAIPKEATDTIQLPARKLNAGVKPLSDEVFQAFRSLYSYDKLPLNASTEPYGDKEEDSTAEKVSYNAAYGNERASAYLFLPKHAKPPFQTVVIFPGETAFQTPTFSLSSTRALDLVPALLKSGRAVLFPVYKGSYDRGGGTNFSNAETASARRDLTLFWVKDASRAIDYAVTRSELDHNKVAFYGYSGGADIAVIVAATDPRIKVCLLAMAGVDGRPALPEADSTNFLARVKQPVLMLNGRYDFYAPVELAQDPFFRMLGTRQDQKKHLLFDSGHIIPLYELISATRYWLDHYVGAVN